MARIRARKATPKKKANRTKDLPAKARRAGAVKGGGGANWLMGDGSVRFTDITDGTSNTIIGKTNPKGG
jgi:prepilin-type processing-associated H-X9-DG protein